MKPLPVARLALFAVLAATALAADLSSKAIVFHDLGYPGGAPFAFRHGTHLIFEAPAGREGESIAYLEGWSTFRLFTSFNPGALWGLGQRYTGVFTLLSLAAVAGIPIWLFGFGGVRSRWLTCALALILGGTLGNLYDRVGWSGCLDLNGVPIKAVRDFLLFTFGGFHWPVFNIADVCLVIGASMLVLHSFSAAHTAVAPVVSTPAASPVSDNGRQDAVGAAHRNSPSAEL